MMESVKEGRFTIPADALAGKDLGCLWLI